MNSSFRLHPSSFIPVFAIFYVAATFALFIRFFWLSPLSGVSLLTVALTAFCYRATRRDPARGMLVLSFLTPLVGSLPHLAPVRCPPPLLLIVAGFALGRLIGLQREPSESTDTAPNRPAGGTNAVALLFLLFAVSGTLTAWRYLNNAPFGGWPALNATINVRQESASDALGAVWQTLVIMLSGPLVFLLATTIRRDEDWPSRWARFVLAGMFLACVVGVIQLLFFPALGNDPYWVKRNRINATFTDANGLGAFVALVFSLMAAMAVGASKRWCRLVGVAVVLLSLAMLAGSGSRTGTVGVVFVTLLFPAVLALRLGIENAAFRQRVLLATLVFAIAFVAFAPLESRWEGKRWVLLSRLTRTRDVIARQGWLALVVRDRWPLWEPTIHVARRYPVGGIGLGAFRYEMENIARLDGQKWRWLDNANNSYLQIFSELGLIGLAIVLATFVTLARAMACVIRSPRLTGETRWVYAALGTSWFGFLFLLLTAMWLLFEQIQVMFWLFAAVFAGHPDFPAAADWKRRRRFVSLALVSVAVIAGYQVVHGFGDLSPARRRAALGLEQSEGFYAWETDETGRRFRWTAEEARLVVPTGQGEIRVEMLARNPDLTSRPLVLWISLRGKTASRCEIISSNWRWVRVPVPPDSPNPAELRIRVERTWRPKDFRLSKDDRTLGVAIARIENTAPTDPLPP